MGRARHHGYLAHRYKLKQANLIKFFEPLPGEQVAEEGGDGLVRSVRWLSRQCDEMDESVLVSSGLHYWLQRGVLEEIADPAGAGAGAGAAGASAPPEYNSMGDVLGLNRFFRLVEAQQAFVTDDSIEVDDYDEVGPVGR